MSRLVFNAFGWVLILAAIIVITRFAGCTQETNEQEAARKEAEWKAQGYPASEGGRSGSTANF